jgi:hypothetical protein
MDEREIIAEMVFRDMERAASRAAKKARVCSAEADDVSALSKAAAKARKVMKTKGKGKGKVKAEAEPKTKEDVGGAVGCEVKRRRGRPRKTSTCSDPGDSEYRPGVRVVGRVCKRETSECEDSDDSDAVEGKEGEEGTSHPYPVELEDVF